MNMVGPNSCQRHIRQYRPHMSCAATILDTELQRTTIRPQRGILHGLALAVHTTSRTWDTIRTETQPCVTSRAIVTICSRFPSRHHQCASSLNHLTGPVMMSFVILVVMVALAQPCDPSQSLVLACIRSSSPVFVSRPQVHPSLIFGSAKQEMLSVTKPPSACFWRLPCFGRHLPQLRHCALTWVEPSPPFTPIAAVALPSTCRIHHRSAPLPTCTYLSEVVTRVLALLPLSLGLGIL